MLTANEILQNEAIAKAVDFSAYNNGVVRRILALLNRVDADLFAQISAALEQLPAESFTVERLESLLYSVRATNKAAYDAVSKELTAELRDLVTYEAGYQQQLFASVLPVQVNVASVVVEQVYSAAMARPFQGLLLKDALAGLEAGRAAKIRDALRMGYVEGQTISQMVTRLRGTRARGYEDGLLEISRRDAAAVVRTATSHVAGFTRDRFYESNASLIKAVVWCSTIDARTTKSFCIPRDGKQYHPVTHAPIGHSMPWGAGPGRIHWCCRASSTVALKSWRELGIDMDELPASTRASLDGQIPESTTYLQWLNKQSAARQDDIMGPVRGALMRSGAKAESFYDNKGRFLALDKLRERDAAMFSKAGL